jgi:glycosyltransferase involved in cell wall biosynthesis
MSGSITKPIFEKHKCCVIIPTYNNDRTLPAVINGCQQFCNDIWVINDGSTDTTADILSKTPGITVITQEVNKGKGAALRRAFKEAFEAGFMNAVTIDSDGQHEPADLASFADVLDKDPEVIYIGARNMGQHSIPGKSKFGHKNSNFWFWVETGIKAEDTQSGYRLYPLKAVQFKRTYTWRYEFEIEVIVRAAWKGTDVKFIPVKVYYPEDRVSHFRPLKDFTRVAILNVWLVFLAFHWFRPIMYFRKLKKKNLRQILRDHLIKPDEPVWKKSFAMGVGIFCGIIPIWGFQTVAAIGLSFVFKLNKPLTLLASNISIPPMIPFIVYCSLALGGIVLDGSLPGPIPEFSEDIILKDLTRYIVGSVFLAILAGSIGAIITWAVAKLLMNKKQRVDVGVK